MTKKKTVSFKEVVKYRGSSMKDQYKWEIQGVFRNNIGEFFSIDDIIEKLPLIEDVTSMVVRTKIRAVVKRLRRDGFLIAKRYGPNNVKYCHPLNAEAFEYKRKCVKRPPISIGQKFESLFPLVDEVFNTLSDIIRKQGKLEIKVVADKKKCNVDIKIGKKRSTMKFDL